MTGHVVHDRLRLGGEKSQISIAKKTRLSRSTRSIPMLRMRSTCSGRVISVRTERTAECRCCFADGGELL
jgi:hypothetical protein